jgi:hypothetical protein
MPNAPAHRHVNAGWAAFAYAISFTVVGLVPIFLLYRNPIFLEV